MSGAALQTPFGRGFLNVIQTALVNVAVDDPTFSKEAVSRDATLGKFHYEGELGLLKHVLSACKGRELPPAFRPYAKSHADLKAIDQESMLEVSRYVDSAFQDIRGRWDHRDLRLEVDLLKAIRDDPAREGAWRVYGDVLTERGDPLGPEIPSFWDYENRRGGRSWMKPTKLYYLHLRVLTPERAFHQYGITTGHSEMNPRKVLSARLTVNDAEAYLRVTPLPVLRHLDLWNHRGGRDMRNECLEKTISLLDSGRMPALTRLGICNYYKKGELLVDEELKNRFEAKVRELGLWLSMNSARVDLRR